MSLKNLVFVVSALGVTGCGLRQSNPTPMHETVVLQEVASVPEGTQEHCWEEPRVVREKVGPGLDGKGNWYQPPHDEFREVKMGRYKVCQRK